MTKQELQDELEWRAKKVYTPKEKKAFAQVARNSHTAKRARQIAQVKTYLESRLNKPRNQIASVNLKKSIAIQTQHNDRTAPPSYLLESGGMGVEYNRDNHEAQALKEQLISEASKAYTSRTGQKLQAKSYEWSAVVNLKPDSTMEQLEQFAEWVNKYYGFQCYQIAIHRDEGYIDENGKEQINHHAHLEFITLDKESGKNRIRDTYGKPIEMKKWQTRIANILGMERGESKATSGRERIEPRAYAKIAEEIKKEAQEKLLGTKEIKALIEQERKAWIAEQGHTAEEYKALRALQERTYKEKQELEQEIQKLKESLKNQKGILEAFEKEKMDLNDKYKLLEQELKDSKQLKAITNGDSDNPIAIFSQSDGSVIVSGVSKTTLTEPNDLIQENKLLRIENARKEMIISETRSTLEDIAQAIGRTNKKTDKDTVTGVKMLLNELKELKSLQNDKEELKRQKKEKR